jgi:hypothetical protein
MKKLYNTDKSFKNKKVNEIEKNIKDTDITL